MGVFRPPLPPLSDKLAYPPFTVGQVSGQAQIKEFTELASYNQQLFLKKKKNN